MVVPVNAELHRLEVESIVGDSQARWAFVTSDAAPDPLHGLERPIDAESAQADELLAPVADWADVPAALRSADDLAWLF